MSDDVAAEQTPGFKVGEKKTLDEYHKLGEFHLIDSTLSTKHGGRERIWVMHGHKTAGLQMYTKSPSCKERRERVVCDIFVCL